MKKIEQEIKFYAYSFNDFPQDNNIFVFCELEISPDEFINRRIYYGYGSREVKEVKNFSPQKEEKLFLIYSLFSYWDYHRGHRSEFIGQKSRLNHAIICDAETVKAHCLKLTEALREEGNKRLENERINYEMLKK